MQPDGCLRILTLNAWLLRIGRWRVAWDLASRAERLPAEAAATGADVIALQEVWPEPLAEALITRFARLGYAHALRGDRRGGLRLLGDGLLLVSRHPLARAARLRFAARTVWYEPFIAKGALAADVALPGGPMLRLATAHLAVVRFDTAQGGFRADDAVTRSAQLEQLAQWLEGEAGPAASQPLIIAGDLNLADRPYAEGAYDTSPDAEHTRMLQRMRLEDAFREAGPGGDGFTFDPATNPYAARGPCRGTPGQRIDYVLYRKGHTLRARSVSIVFREPPLLSDHYGLLAEFALA